MSQEFKKYVFPHPELPQSIAQVKDNAQQMLGKLLSDMFNGCDDLFFDLSGRAVSNTEQNLYFESMREIRLKKGVVKETFKRDFANSFKALTEAEKNTGDDSNQKDLTADTLDGLSLLGNDQLEVKVAISGMTTKARNKYQEELYHLTCRLDYLIKHKTINETDNPLEPEAICLLFSQIIDQLELDIKARIILLKQFDRMVINGLGKVYDQSNQLLINAGILPKITSSIKKSGQGQNGSSPANASQQNTGEQAEPSEQDNIAATLSAGAYGSQNTYVSGQFSEIQNLINGLRGMGVQTPSVIAVIPGYNSGAPSLNRMELVNSLTNIQQMPETASGDIDIRQAIGEIITTNSQSGSPKSIATIDEDIINLVAMFFDFVLDDKNIPVEIQALISRLQIPVLKLALKDKQFLNNNDHPARNLINEMAASAIGWNDANKHSQDKLYEQLSVVVNNVLDNYTDNSAIFSEELIQLREMLEADDKRSSLIERRANEAAVGKAKTNHAREQIQRLLASRTANKTLAQEVHQFLNHHWQKVLLFVILRNGEDSPEWLESVQVIDDLIWATSPHEDEKSLQRLAGLKTKLIDDIQTGLSKITMSSTEVDGHLQPLKNILQYAEEQEFEEINYTPVEENPLSEELEERKTWGNMTAIERQQAKRDKLDYEYIKTVDKLPLGSWVEFAANDGDHHSRGKLTAKVEETESFIFLNRFGAKVTEIKRKAFAYNLQKGTARILDKRPLFERALTSLGQNLKNLGKNQSND